MADRTRKVSYQRSRWALLSAFVGTAMTLPGQDLTDTAAKLTQADAVTMESSLEEAPDDLQNRKVLATYYGIRGDKSKRLEHALWLAENHPEAVGGCVYCKVTFQDSPLDSVESFERARPIWLRHAELRTSESNVLMNAAGFIVQFDPNLAERLLLQGRELEPKNRRWAEALADIYGKGIFTDGRFRPQTPPSPSRQAFARRARLVLEKSTDPVIVGLAGLRLAPQDVSILRTRSAENVSLGEQLLHRARDLAPKDPQWEIYIRDFEAARRDLGRPNPEAPTGDEAPGTLVRRVEPEYPETARRSGIEGIVQLRILIGSNGRVIIVRPVDGPLELQAAAALAVKQWIYKPFLMNGNPVEMSKEVEIRLP